MTDASVPDLVRTLDEKRDLIKNLFAPDASGSEFEVFMELARRYRLDPFAKQIWAVTYGGKTQIFAGRDGFLALAHRSGQFDGMESGVGVDLEGKIYGWAKVYRKDMSHPFEDRAYLDEYNTRKNLWATKPKTMIQKVAEVHALRKAFTVSGLYAPEEFGDVPESAPAGNITNITAEKPYSAEPSPAAEPKKMPKLVYNSMQAEKSREVFRGYGWSLEIFEKARITDDTYDREMIDAEYRRRVAEMRTSPASSSSAPDVSAPEEPKSDIVQNAVVIVGDDYAVKVAKLCAAVGMTTAGLTAAKLGENEWDKAKLDEMRANAQSRAAAKGILPVIENDADAVCEYCGAPISQKQMERTLLAVNCRLCSKCAALHRETDVIANRRSA